MTQERRAPCCSVGIALEFDGCKVYALTSCLAFWIVRPCGCSLAILYAYNASNTSGHTKKVTINAITMVTFSLGNIIGTEIFQAKDAPQYIPGKITILVLLVAQIFVALLIRAINVKLNREKKTEILAQKNRHGWTDEDMEKERERHAFADLTDRQ